MERLTIILNRPVKDTPRTRLLQQAIDGALDETIQRFDLRRGLAATKGFGALPDERDDSFIEKSREERAALITPDEDRALQASASRASSATLAVMAWCWQYPRSRYYRSPMLLDCARAGLKSFRRRFRSDGTWVFGTWSDGGFSHGWTVEGLIWSYVWLFDQLDPAEREGLVDMFRRAAEFYLAQRHNNAFHPVSNQHAVWCMNMTLYGLLFDESRYLRAAQEEWRICREVFARGGQVLEQGGPCANYSRTTFIYAYLYILFSGNGEHEEDMREALWWFRRMHTNSMYPFEGMSSRAYHLKTHHMLDEVAAAERLSPREPVFSRFIDEFLAQEERDHGQLNAIGHGASPLIWAMMEHPGVIQPAQSDIAKWEKPFDRMYRTWDIQYLVVRRAYQTCVTFRGRLPMKGLQTWAWRDEPPILHPSLDIPSKTQAWGIDTAEFNIGATHPDIGAGAKAEQALYVPGDWKDFGDGRNPGGMTEMMTPADPCSVATRWGKLWCYYIFTPVSAVIIQNGAVGRRVTRWACNSLTAPKPNVHESVARFEGREGRLHFLGRPPQVREEHDLPGQPTPLAVRRTVSDAEVRAAREHPVYVLEFEFAPDELAVFAFGDASFCFLEYNQSEQTLTYKDSAGRYQSDFSKIMGEDGYLIWDYGARTNRTT
jgi:hypothetical protein